jgi:hypothetical protein
MTKRIKAIADALGAKVITELPRTGGGAFGAARLGKVVADLQKKLIPSHGKRPGRPTKAGWSRRPKVPMSKATENRLAELAQMASTPTRRVSPMQLAAQLLEDALSRL